MKGLSIVIPAYNEEQYLPGLLASLQIAQKFLVEQLGILSEVLVVNNDSTDQTKQVALSYRATVIDYKIRNISAVRNAGIAKSRFDYIVMIDADCIFPKDGLVQIYKNLNEDDIIGGALNVQVLSSKKSIQILAVIVQFIVMHISGISGAMFFFKKEAAQSIGGFSESHLIAEDSVFALQMKKYAKKNSKKFIFLKSVLIKTKYRKESSMHLILPAVQQLLFSFMGKKQSMESLKYWYKPER